MANYNQDKLFEHLNSKWGDTPCPMCKGDKGWGVLDKIVEFPEYTISKSSGQSTVLPVIPVTCKNCGYTVVINAITIGLVDSSGEVNESE
ncbi:TPA: hypothetical protein NKQ44_004442 [Vibrio parahaemolyticus]|nr:hypothetical protein [Vibrio parahaemolyticus]HCH1613843.1 hypothetical protein [Vibrio parahaemolyticus]